MPWITDDIRRKMSRCFELFKQEVKLKDGEIRHDYNLSETILRLT